MSDICTFPGCDNRRRSRSMELCEGHYYQRRRGHDLKPLRPRRIDQDDCAIDGCSSPRAGGRYCAKHAARIKRHGDPDKVIPHRERALPRGAQHPDWTGVTGTYAAIHQRLRKIYGPAKQFPCTFSCGAQAAQWAYVGPRQAGERNPWGSIDQYSPLCITCHKTFDVTHLGDKVRQPSRRPAWRDEGVRMYQAGMGTYQIAKALGLGPTTIYRGLVAEGVTMRPATRRRSA